MRRLSALTSILLLASLAPLRAQSSALVADTRTQPASARPADPLSPEARGDIFMARKNYREAIETYLRAKPLSAMTLNKIGICYHQLGDLTSASRYYQRSIKSKSDYAEAINNLGTVYYSQKGYRRSISTYRRALKYSPDSASIVSNLGTAYFARKDYKKATELYERALQLDPEVFEHRGTNGVLLQERSVAERAKFHYYLAKSYAKNGRSELALLYIRKSLEEGFKERAKYMEEKEFTDLRKLPEFDELMKLAPRVL